MSTQDDTIDFETSLQQLEDIVTQMEQGTLSLEQSLSAFERGVKLTRDCQKTLKDAEQRVRKLVEQADGNIALEDFKREDA